MFEHLKIPEQCRPVIVFKATAIHFAWVWTDNGRLPLASSLEVWHERHMMKWVAVGNNKGVDSLAKTGPGKGTILLEPAAYSTLHDVQRLVAIENPEAVAAFMGWKNG